LGIYFPGKADRTAIIAIHQLPKSLDTLWLRLLGKGNVQSQAIAELLALPKDHPYRQDTIHHLAILQINFQVRQNKTQDIQEVIMNLSPAYQKWREETLAEGEARGKEQERRSLAQKMLQEGASIDFISRVTGFSAPEIAALK
jgi:hypothetical protein